MLADFCLPVQSAFRVQCHPGAHVGVLFQFFKVLFSGNIGKDRFVQKALETLPSTVLRAGHRAPQPVDSPAALWPRLRVLRGPGLTFPSWSYWLRGF